MATLLELSSLFNNGDLIKKISAAVLITVKALLDATPTAADRTYAAKVFETPHKEAHRVLRYLLAANESATVANITGSSDTAIQTEVDAAVPILIDADAGV